MEKWPIFSIPGEPWSIHGRRPAGRTTTGHHITFFTGVLCRTTSHRSSRQCTSVLLNVRFRSPKHQFWANSVCSGGMKLMVTETCFLVIARRAAKYAWSDFLFCPEQLLQWRYVGTSSRRNGVGTKCHLINEEVRFVRQAFKTHAKRSTLPWCKAVNWAGLAGTV